MIVLFLCVLCTFLVILPKLLKFWVTHCSKNLKKEFKGKITVGFFHPYCNAGGGGERVLWCAVRAIQNKYPKIQCIVYTGDTDVSGTEIIKKAKVRFNIAVKSDVKFIFLRKRKWVEAERYPVFTLLAQSLGSMVLGWEALTSYAPDIYIDSMGYAFTLPLFRYLGGSKTISYVHYPTISTDMLEFVANRTEAHNNASFISRSKVLTFSKLWYYKFFAFLYGLMGRRSDKVMVNSTWTYGHIKELWKVPEKTFIVYPPCNILDFKKLPLTTHKSLPYNIISISQFRPEKNQSLQISSFANFLDTKTVSEKKNYKLLLVGSCRNEGDRSRVEELQNFCGELKVTEYVEFKLNVSFDELKDLMSASTIGIHTMWNEHFGIGVVELMAAGVIILAHNSGGPKLDIVTEYNQQKTGFLADDIETYAKAMETIFNLTNEKKIEIMENARESVNRFSDEEFEQGFLSVSESLLDQKG